jgi:hypothetical protein
MEDKRDFTPQPPTHPVPSYVAEADENEHEAWQAYIRVVEQELESEKDDPDYERLQQAKEKWQKVADAQLEARNRWNNERYKVKSKIATLMGKETNYEWRKVKEQL